MWIGLHFPNLALDVCDFDAGLPALVLDQNGGQQRVHAACAVAMDHGIAPGMSLNAVHALCRNLSIRLRDPEAEYRRLCLYSDRLRVFTPNISPGKWRTAANPATGRRMNQQTGQRVGRKRGRATATNQVLDASDNADSLLLEVAGSLRLFGGLAGLIDRIRNEFSDHHAPPLLSIAPCPAAALLLARNGLEKVIPEQADLRTALGDVALDGADLEPKLVARLQRCGLRRLRDLWRMPRKDLGRRFGADLLVYLDRLSGEQPEPVANYQPALCFRQRMGLPVDTRHSKLIVLAARRLLDEARRFLEMHAAATEVVRFDLWHVNRTYTSQAYGSRSRTTLTVRSGQADRRPERFLPQFEEQLDRLVIEQEVDTVSILIDQVVPVSRTTEDLFSRHDQEAGEWTQLTDLLAARLGNDRVYTLASSADHRPERAWQKAELNGQIKSEVEGEGRTMARRPLPRRPLWLLDSPRPLGRNAMTLRGEAERIEAGWWERRDVRRDYRVAEGRGESGGWGWVYRNLRDEDCESGWHLHGLFG